VNVRISGSDQKPAPLSAPPAPAKDRSARWDHVLTLLASTKRLSVSEVARELGVSESTVRRDFVEMERGARALIRVTA